MTRPTAVLTLGVFDGFHRGHAALLAETRGQADRAGARVLALTFENHPLEVLAGTRVSPLQSVGEKVRRLRAAGADTVRVLRFTTRLAALDPPEFLAEHVFPYVRLVGFVVGHDFAMGRERQGTVERLRALGERLGFRVLLVPALVQGDGPVSSTRIRDALAAGRIEEAAALLGRDPSVRGRVVPGRGRGRELGYPTANVDLKRPGAVPAHGVYAVRIRASGQGARPGVANFGMRPTFGEAQEAFEVHVLDGPVELEDREVDIDLVARIRDERKFNGPDELKQQIGLDADRARRLLTATHRDH